MQQIERYGVIALVFLLVTIVAISFWGDSKSPGFWARLTGKGNVKKEQVEKPSNPQPAVGEHIVDSQLPVGPSAAIDPTASQAPSAGSITPFQNGAPFAQNQGMPGAHPPVPVVIIDPNLAHSGLAANASRPGTAEYVVRDGDSLARIATKMLGNENRWGEIQALNGNLDPKSLAVGQKIKLPAADAKPNPTGATEQVVAKTGGSAEKNAAKSSVSSTYVVQKGDRLTTIAQRMLGDASRWKDIAAANPGINVDKLAVGQKIKLPGSAEKSAAKKGPLVASALSSSPANAASAKQAEKPRVR